MDDWLNRFKTRFPDVFTATDNQVILCMTDAENRMDKVVWGRMYEQGLMYLTAHLLWLGGFHPDSPAAGQPASEPNTLIGSHGVGDVSIGMNFTGTKSDWLKTSAFGEHYLDLESRINNYTLAVGMSW